jgi:hypothetical protein
MAGSIGWQDIVGDDVDRDRLVDHLGRAAVRCSWRGYAFAVMLDRLHVVLETPHPRARRPGLLGIGESADPEQPGRIVSADGTQGFLSDSIRSST